MSTSDSHATGLPPNTNASQVAKPEFVPVPPKAPQTPCTPEDILFGPPVEPQLRIRGYSPDEFEDFVREWAFYYGQLKLGRYTQVGRFGGAGDMGRDVVGYIDPPASGVRLDIFQCKHYGNPLQPGEVWVELGKLCYYTHIKAFAVPEAYRFVAPDDVGPELGRLLEKPSELRDRLISEWKNAVEGHIVKRTPVKLEGQLLDHVRRFDFSLIGYKPIHEIIEEHKQTVRYPPRFGGGLLIARPGDPTPPAAIQAHEQRYVEQLIEAYQNHEEQKRKVSPVTIDTLGAHAEYDRHFARSRERYFCAEALRLAVRDNLPDGVTFEQAQEQLHDTVVDVADDSGHASGFVRVKAVTDKASLCQIQGHPLRPYMKSKVMMGICHQLANVDRLRWVLK